MEKAKIKQGKRNRAAGKRFELKVRADLEKQGWIVFRNSMDVSKPIQTDIGEYERFFKQTTGHWNPFTKSIMMASSGFPDFIAIKVHDLSTPQTYLVQFVEAKSNGYLDKEEREKVKWLLEKLCIKTLIAKKGEGGIEYR